MFEHKRQPLLPSKAFYKRLAFSFFLAILIIFLFLLIGILGYHITEGFSWLDSLLNASMILSGMGPVNPIKNDAGKWFASFYAILSGVVFITTAGVILAPLVHRFLHKFHLEIDR